MGVLRATDWGYLDMMNVYFRNGLVPSAFHVRLLSAPVADGTKNWADVAVNELPTGGGYTQGGKSIQRNGGSDGYPILAVVSGNPEITSCHVSWTATSDWPVAVNAVCLVAVRASEQLVFYSNIATQTVLQNDTVGWTIKFSLKKV